MKNSNPKEISKNKGCLTSLAAAATGAVIGAGAVAGAVIMSDKKNQKKVAQMADDVKDQIQTKKVQVEKKVKKIGNLIKDTTDNLIP